MADFNVRADSVNVEQIMEQIRARIREKRGVDYTEEQIRELAAVKLQKFLDPRGVRSDLLDQFRRAQPPYQPPELPNYAFEDSTLFDSHRGILRFARRLLKPVLKLFFNPNPLIQALHIQSRVNTLLAEREARLEAARHATESLYYELIHNLVVETTRLGIEVKNLTMRVESMSSRLEFNERRARALESNVSALVYPPATNGGIGTTHPAAAGVSPLTGQRDARGAAQQGQHIQQTRQGPLPQGQPVDGVPGGEGPGQRSRRRRRRRGRRGNLPATAVIGGGQPQPFRPSEPAARADSSISAESPVLAEPAMAGAAEIPVQPAIPAGPAASDESAAPTASAQPGATPSPTLPPQHGDRQDEATRATPAAPPESEPQ